MFCRMLEVVPPSPTRSGTLLLLRIPLLLLLDGRPLLTGRFAPLGLANGSWPLRAEFATTPVTALAVGFEPPSISCIKKTKAWSGSKPPVDDPAAPEPTVGKGPELATVKGLEPVVGRGPGPVAGKGPELATGKGLEPVVGRGPEPLKVFKGPEPPEAGPVPEVIVVEVGKGPEPDVGNGPGLVGTKPISSSSLRSRAAET